MQVANPKIFNLMLPKKILTALVVFGFSCLFLSFVGAGTAHAFTNVAIDNNAPTPNSGTDSANNNFTPLTGVGHGNFDGKYMWYKIYVPLGHDTTITVKQVCKDLNSPTVDYWIESLSDTEKDWTGNFGNLTNNWISTTKTSSLCSAQPTIYIQGGGPNQERGIASSISGHQNYRVFAFIAHIQNGPDVNDERYFSVSSDDNQAYIGMSSKDVSCTAVNFCKVPLKFSTIYKPNASGNPWDASVMFAPACDQNTSGNYNTLIYDADNGIYQNNFHATLEASKAHPVVWSQVKSWNANIVQGLTPPAVAPAPPWAQTGTTGTLSYGNYQNNVAYKLNLLGINYPNTVQVQLPFDQFNASTQNAIGCTKLSCKVTPNFGGDPNIVQVVVTNNAPYKWGRGYQVREKYPAGNPVFDGAYAQNWPSLSSNPSSDGFSTDLAANGGTKTSTNSLDPANKQYFYRPANASVQFVLYDDTGSGATQLNWDNNQACGASGNISISCGSGIPTTGAPGKSFNSTYKINTNNTGAAAPGYKLVAAADGAGVIGPTVTNSPISIPPGTSQLSITITIMANYAGEYTVTLFDPFGTVVNPTPCHQPIKSQVSPYFQVWQNDAAAGGGFKTDQIACPGATGNKYPAKTGYVSPTTDLVGNVYKGGIIANSASVSPPYQSMSDFGAVALGKIPGPPTYPTLGFYTSVGNTAPTLRTWFANNVGGGGGGFPAGYLNSSSSFHCVDDYYTITKISTSLTSVGSLASAIAGCPADAAGMRRCQFNLSVGTTDLAGISIPNHYQITIYVKGDITIDSNISYFSTFDPRDPADVPYFALIAQGGNISLKNAVTSLDGLYIAQPASIPGGGINTATGAFSTCDIDPCNNQLVVNGAVIAQHVQLLRAHGASEDLGLDPDKIGQAPAEIFNFVPSMVLGAPAFSTLCQQTLNLKASCTQGTYSIAPVF